MFKKIFIIFITGILVLGINELSFSTMCHGEGSSHHRHKQFTETESGEDIHSEAEYVTESTSEETVNVGNQICPVSDEKIDEKTKATYEYEAKIYNFCCAKCVEDFKKEPEKYIKKVEQELQAELEEQSKHKEHEMGMMQESGESHKEMH